MQGSPFGNSSVQDSIVNTDAYKCGPQGLMANNSPIQQLTINNIVNNYGPGDTQTGRQSTGPRVSYKDPDWSELRNPTVDLSKTSKIPVPPTISRLLNRDESAEVHKSADSRESSCSLTSRTTTTTTTGGKPSYHFTAIEETHDTMKKKLKLRVRAKPIRKYMKSEFFFSDTAIPLWAPSPGSNSPEGITTCNVCVGDVGFFTADGGFRVLFNAFLSYHENTKIGFNPPHDFERYGPVRSEDVSKIDPASDTDYVSYEGDFKPDSEIHPKRNYIRSYLLDKQRFGKRLGTLLDLPNGFWSDRMYTPVVPAMQEYFDLHAGSWYNYYLKSPGPTNPGGHLYIVSGSYKCNAWALAFCSTDSPDNVFARLYKLSPDTETFYEWDRHPAVVGRKGPLQEEIRDGRASVNQCVAVEVYSIKLTSDGVQKMGASLYKFMSRLSIRSTFKSRNV